MNGKRSNRAVALTLVIALTGLLIISGVTLMITLVDNIKAVRGFESTVLLDNFSVSCLEEGMYRLNKESSYVGDFALAYNGGTCTVVVTNDATPGKKLIEITTTEAGYTRVLNYSVDTLESPYGLDRTDL